jgi:hypothetical protein
MYERLQHQYTNPDAAPDGISTAGPANSTEAVMAQLAYLAAAADVARRRFTLFEQGPIWFGCGAGVLVLTLQLLHCW